MSEPQPPAGISKADWKATPGSVRDLVLRLHLQLLESLTRLAARCVQNEDYQEAATHYPYALAITEYLGERERQAELMGNLGGVYMALAEYEQARICSHEATKLSEAIGAEEVKARALTNLGSAHLSLRRSQEAI